MVEGAEKILDVPDEHLPYLEETVYPTLLTALQRLLQRVEVRAYLSCACHTLHCMHA